MERPLDKKQEDEKAAQVFYYFHGSLFFVADTEDNIYTRADLIRFSLAPFAVLSVLCDTALLMDQRHSRSVMTARAVLIAVFNALSQRALTTAGDAKGFS